MTTKAYIFLYLVGVADVSQDKNNGYSFEY